MGNESLRVDHILKERNSQFSFFPVFFDSIRPQSEAVFAATSTPAEETGGRDRRRWEIEADRTERRFQCHEPIEGSCSSLSKPPQSPRTVIDATGR
jgi:hypothetical protein